MAESLGTIYFRFIRVERQPISDHRTHQIKTGYGQFLVEARNFDWCESIAVPCSDHGVKGILNASKDLRVLLKDS